MDLRDDTHGQLMTHIGTLRALAALENPAPLVWAEAKRVLAESATYLETFVAPKIEPTKSLLDLMGRNEAPTIARYVPATSQEALEEDAAIAVAAGETGFLKANGAKA